ncbi:hypothetical protein D3C78_750470 [compost metagenome]
MRLPGRDIPERNVIDGQRGIKNPGQRQKRDHGIGTEISGPADGRNQPAAHGRHGGNGMQRHEKRKSGDKFKHPTAFSLVQEQHRRNRHGGKNGGNRAHAL